MKEILVFGAGKSATVLIDHLLQHAADGGWQVVVADASEEAARKKIGASPHGRALGFDINDTEKRNACIADATLVVSLLPAALHFLVAQDCLKHRKNLLTASYVDAAMRSLADAVKSAGLLFLCEMGLDPGIDHMSAKKMIDGIQAEGGSIGSFLSHCGGLVAPASDDNPWHYKISWNPRNVVTAGKAGAIYRQNGEVVELEYPELFAEKRYVSVPGGGVWCWYPNRDSLSYIPIYGLPECATFIRTTLRHPDFMYGWKNVIDLRLTDETPSYESEGKTLSQFFHEHFERNDFTEWLEERLHQQFDATKNLLAELVNLVELEQKAAEKGIEQADEFMVVDDHGDLQRIDIDDLKINAATTLADRMHDASLTLKQLFFLGMDDNQTRIDKGLCSPADVLQLALEKKLALRSEDRDMIIMLHEIEYEQEGKRKKMTGTLTLEGDDELHTAMAKTVGLPLAIAARLILDGTIKETGLHIPVSPQIYEPVLQALEAEGIRFHEAVTDLS